MPLGHELQSLQSLPRGGLVPPNLCSAALLCLACAPCQTTLAELSVRHKTCKDWDREEEYPAVV